MSIVLLAADSIGPRGQRLSTFAAQLAPQELAAISLCENVVCSFAGDDQPWRPREATAVVISGSDFADVHHIDVLHELAQQITGLLAGSDPAELGAAGLHSPFVADDERQLDLSLQGVLSCARCGQQGASGGIVADIDHYHRMIAARPPQLTALQHTALPVQHPAVADLHPSDGPFPGWYTWRQIMIHRGEPL